MACLYIYRAAERVTEPVDNLLVPPSCLRPGDLDGFDAHLDATFPQRFVGGGSIAVPVSVAFGGKELIERYSCSDKLRLPSRWFVQAVKGASCYGGLIHVTRDAG